MKTHNIESGRSMIEMLGVLAISGVLSVGGIAGYSKAMMKYRTNKTIEQISMIVTNVRTLFGSQKNYKALGAATNGSLIAKAKLFPDELITSDGIIANGNPFGGNIYLQAGARSSTTETGTCTGCGDAKSFVLVFDNIPEEACMDLATQDWGSASGSGLIQAKIIAGELAGADAGDDCKDAQGNPKNGCTPKAATSGTVTDFAKTAVTTCTVGEGVACGGKGPMTAANAAAVCGTADGKADQNALLLKFY